jgi:hypothetical protein
MGEAVNPDESTYDTKLTPPLVRRWLVAEYCGHDIYMGWHLYLRDDPGYQKRNKDGGWGWLRGPVWERDRAGNKIVAFFAAAFGIDLQGDWSCGRYGLSEFVKRFPLPGRKVWGERRGGIEVMEDYWGNLALFRPTEQRMETAELKL